MTRPMPKSIKKEAASVAQEALWQDKNWPVRAMLGELKVQRSASYKGTSMLEVTCRHKKTGPRIVAFSAVIEYGVLMPCGCPGFAVDAEAVSNTPYIVPAVAVTVEKALSTWHTHQLNMRRAEDGAYRAQIAKLLGETTEA